MCFLSLGASFHPSWAGGLVPIQKVFPPLSWQKRCIWGPSWQLYQNSWELTDWRLAKSTLICQQAAVAWMEAVSMQTLDMLGRLYPSRLFSWVCRKPDKSAAFIYTMLLWESKSDFFCMWRNHFSSQIFLCNILLPSSLLQLGDLNADPRRHKISIRRTSTKAFF